MIDPSTMETFRRFRRSLPARARVYVAGCSGEPRLLAGAIREDPSIGEGITFLGVWIPGVNRTPWPDLVPGGTGETIFLSPELRPSFIAGRAAFRPLSYSAAVRWLRETAIDGAVIMTTADGTNLGTSADFSGEVAARPGIQVLRLRNEALPKPRDGVAVSLPEEAFDVICEVDLTGMEGGPLSFNFERLGAHVAELIDDGRTLQFGLGTLQQAVLGALSDKRKLRIHSGMVSDPLLALLEAGAIDDTPGSITTGVAIGSGALHRRAAEDPSFHFRPVAFTHDLRTLAAIEGFTAINSAIEVDLFGQVNAEFMAGRQISGTGGLIDFSRGAALAPGAMSIVGLPSCAKGGTVSRIVPRLGADVVSLPRSDTDIIVTEHGVARLRGKSLEERAEALIAVAHPPAREGLAAAWAEMRKGL